MTKQKIDTKAFKRALQQSENYHRRGFGHEVEVGRNDEFRVSKRF